jgi:hypothetical protein
LNSSNTHQKKIAQQSPVLDGIENKRFELVHSNIAQTRNILALHMIAIKVITYVIYCPNQQLVILPPFDQLGKISIVRL